MAQDDKTSTQQATNRLIDLLEHPGFKIMQLRLDADKQKALEELATVDPENSPRIIDLQEVVARANYYFDTVTELIEQGLSEEDLLELEEPIEDDGAETGYDN